jgi:hypothetical protein
VTASTKDPPTSLLYLLSVGKEKELALQIHGTPPTEDQLASWMQNGSVSRLRVSSHGEKETFTLLVNFAHIVAARLAPYGTSRSASF